MVDQLGGAGRLIINPSSYIPWLTTKGAVQIDPTKLSVLISQPLLNAVPLLASAWQGMLSHHIPAAPPTPSPVPTLLFSLSQVVTAQASRKESNRDRSYCSAKRQEKNNQKSRGLKKDQNYFSNRMGKSNIPYHYREQALCKRPGLWLACRLFWIDAWHCQRTWHCVAERHLQHCIKIRLSCHPQTSQSCCSFFLSFFLKEERRKIRNVPRIRPSKPDKCYFWKTSETGRPSKATN